MDKKDEEQHSMSKPKPLEVVSDGDLTEIKKDPVWKTWLEKKDEKEDKQEDKHAPVKDDDEEPSEFEDAVAQVEEEGEKLVGGEVLNTGLGGVLSLVGLSYKSRLDNITKPIPDSKGGKGSFQHCIDTNQDKHNPGGWCKQIERKIEGKKKGKDEGEEEEVKISTYEKLRRIKDRLHTHKKKAKKQTKIDEPKHWWDHSKVGTNTGWDDDPMNKPSYFQAIMEEERKRRERKKAGEDATEDVVSMVKRRKRLQDYFEGNEKKKGLTGRKCEYCGKKLGMISPHKYCQECAEKHSSAIQDWKDEHLINGDGDKPATSGYIPEKKKGDKIEEPETDYYMDAGGNPQLKEKAEKKDTWNCSLCNIELPNDSDADKRKKRHADFHVDESIQTGGRQRNWTFGDAKFTLGKQKADYFIEEIRSNIIYHNKILPIVGMIAGQAARGMGKMGKKIGGEILEGASDLTSGVLQGIGDEEEEE